MGERKPISSVSSADTRPTCPCRASWSCAATTGVRGSAARSAGCRRRRTDTSAGSARSRRGTSFNHRCPGAVGNHVAHLIDGTLGVFVRSDLAVDVDAVVDAGTAGAGPWSARRDAARCHRIELTRTEAGGVRAAEILLTETGEEVNQGEP